MTCVDSSVGFGVDVDVSAGVDVTSIVIIVVVARVEEDLGVLVV